MTKIILILTIKYPHDAKPDPKQLLHCAWVGFEPGLCNVENVNNKAYAFDPCAMAALGNQCISTRT